MRDGVKVYAERTRAVVAHVHTFVNICVPRLTRVIAFINYARRCVQ